MTKLVVTILDGDRRTRVRGAKVSLWERSGRTDRHGVTTIVAPRVGTRSPCRNAATDLPAGSVDFQRSRRQTVDVYQPDLQWPLYGRDEAAHPGAHGDPAAPALPARLEPRPRPV